MIAQKEIGRKIKCEILDVEQIEPSFTGLILQPLLDEDCPAFSYVVEKPASEFKVGGIYEINVAEVFRLLDDAEEEIYELDTKRDLR